MSLGKSEELPITECGILSITNIKIVKATYIYYNNLYAAAGVTNRRYYPDPKGYLAFHC
jgi:hypothetical protein